MIRKKVYEMRVKHHSTQVQQIKFEGFEVLHKQKSMSLRAWIDRQFEWIVYRDIKKQQQYCHTRIIQYCLSSGLFPPKKLIASNVWIFEKALLWIANCTYYYTSRLSHQCCFKAFPRAYINAFCPVCVLLYYLIYLNLTSFLRWQNTVICLRELPLEWEPNHPVINWTFDSGYILLWSTVMSCGFKCQCSTKSKPIQTITTGN